LVPKPDYHFSDHNRVVKKRVFKIKNTKKGKERQDLIPLLERQKHLYGRAPLQRAADGGFASLEKLGRAKLMGVKDVSFSRKRGLSVLEMVQSQWVYKRLKNFRAGIEANISRLKRVFGLTRCTWTDWAGFKQYVWSAVVSYNLSLLYFDLIWVSLLLLNSFEKPVSGWTLTRH
jgi:IS5 family transposase